jgi:hypothetical protein
MAPKAMKSDGKTENGLRNGLWQARCEAGTISNIRRPGFSGLLTLA